MILNFTIRNFGSIKEKQTLSFEAEKNSHLEDFYISTIGKYRVLKIALIYGANASGKTTVLKALDFLRNLVINPLNTRTETLSFEPFLFNDETVSENTTLSIEFIQKGIKYFYEVECNKKAVVKEVLKSFNPNKSTVFERTTDLKSQYSEIKIGRKIKVEKTALKSLEANTLWNNTVLGGFMKTNIEIKELNEVVDWFKNSLQELIYADTSFENKISEMLYEGRISKNDMLTILRKADLNISDILIKENKDEEVFSQLFSSFVKKRAFSGDELRLKLAKYDTKLQHNIDGKQYTLPFELESHGTRRYYALAGILNLLVKQAIVIPVDELDASLHPDLYQFFLLSFLANAKNSQIIATTHNREFLNDKDLIRDDVLWITDKSKDAATELYSFADFDSSVIRDTTNRLNAYKSGKLGGIPNVSDYYL